MTITTGADYSPPSGDDSVKKQVRDALELANYAVSVGAKGTEAQPLVFDDIAKIQETAAKLSLIGIPMQQGTTLTIDDWRAFEEAYYRLATAMSPVTAETLRDTRDTARTEKGYASWRDRVDGLLWGYSPAQRFTREIWYLAITFALLIVFLESYNNYLGLQKDAAAVATCRFVIGVLVPWIYGGLGACAFLLRSAHTYIYQRTFDTRRTPEYFNRILLGAISGGTITLFTEYLAGGGEEGTSAVHLSAAALGFVAGYSGDLLFKLVERVIKAIFPDDDGTTNDDKKDTPPPPKKGGNDGTGSGG